MRARTGILAGIFWLMALPTAGQEAWTEQTARQMLFHASRAEVQVIAHPFLTDADIRSLQSVAQHSVPYYGAIAASPDQGLATQGAPTIAAGNFHDVSAASAAVLADCNARRAPGTAPCVVVAEIRPRGWEPRRLQLSSGATSEFERNYGPARGEKAFAISIRSGGFGLGQGVGARASAVAACNAAGQTADCRVVVAD